jgi:hypothetical protein
MRDMHPLAQEDMSGSNNALAPPLQPISGPSSPIPIITNSLLGVTYRPRATPSRTPTVTTDHYHMPCGLGIVPNVI